MLGARVAGAQPSGTDVATAQALFEDGKRLMQEGKYADACPKLVESQRLDPGGGTLLAIALCHEGEGKTATAWADFNIALTEARKDKRPEREAAATEHIKALDAKLTKARIIVTKKVEGLEVRRDGTLVGEAQWGTPLPIDPGDHQFEASAPGKVTWKQTFPLKGEGQTLDVVVPSLDDDLSVKPNPPPLPPSGNVQPPPPVIEEQSGSSQKTWALVAGGVGVVGLGVGTIFYVLASSKWSDAEKVCPNNKCTNPQNLDLGKDAATQADVATVGFIVGGLGIAAAAALWLTAPNDAPKVGKVRVLPYAGTSGGGIAVGGSL